MAIVLQIEITDGINSELPILNKGTLTIGRSSSCDFTIDDKKVSGKHGSFELKSNGQIFYNDLGSSNGSFLNNTQIQQTQFKINDVLKIGSTSITIDEKRLSPSEKEAIGKGTLQTNESGSSRPAPKISEPKEETKPSESPKRKTVILNKDLKMRTHITWTGGKDKMIEQDESSEEGKLQLDLGKKKK